MDTLDSHLSEIELFRYCHILILANESEIWNLYVYFNVNIDKLLRSYFLCDRYKVNFHMRLSLYDAI